MTGLNQPQSEPQLVQLTLVSVWSQELTLAMRILCLFCAAFKKETKSVLVTGVSGDGLGMTVGLCL